MRDLREPARSAEQQDVRRCHVAKIADKSAAADEDDEDGEEGEEESADQAAVDKAAEKPAAKPADDNPLGL